MEKKLTKNFVLEINIAEHVKTILDPHTPLALRLSGQLLLGLVNIYSRKTRYLADDCTSAFSNIQVVFRTQAAVDMPEDAKVNDAAITMTANFDDLDFEIEDYSIEDLRVFHDNLATNEFNITRESKFSQAASRRQSKGGAESESDIEQPRQAEDPTRMDDFDIDMGGGDQLALAFDLNETEQSNLEFDAEMSTMNAIPAEDLDGLDDGALKENNFPSDKNAENREEEIELDLDFPPEDEKDLAVSANDETKEIKVRQKRTRKRRRQTIDATVEISAEQIKKQLQDTSSLCRPRKVDERVVNPKKARKSSSKRALDFYLGQNLAQGLLEAVTNKIRKALEKSLEKKEDNGEAADDNNLEEKVPDEEFPEFDIAGQLDGLDGLDTTVGGGLNDSTMGGGDISLEIDNHGIREHNNQENEEEEEEEEEGHSSADGKAADRLKRMYNFLKQKMTGKTEITFKDLVGKASRKAAAGVFHEILVLKTRGMIKATQDKPYGAIEICKAKSFNKGLSSQ